MTESKLFFRLPQADSFLLERKKKKEEKLYFFVMKGCREKIEKEKGYEDIGQNRKIVLLKPTYSSSTSRPIFVR